MTKKKTEAAASTDKLSTLRNIIHILRSETVQFIFGLLCIIFSFYLLLAFTSFFFNGGADQSIVANPEAGELLSVDNNIQNSTGSRGAVLAEFLINRCFGFSAYFIAIFLGIAGLQLVKAEYHFRIWKWFISCTILMIWGSIFFGFLFESTFGNSFIYPGGIHGHNISMWLSSQIGATGVILLLLGVAVIYLVYMSRSTIRVVRRILHPSLKKKKDTTVSAAAAAPAPQQNDTTGPERTEEKTPDTTSQDVEEESQPLTFNLDTTPSSPANASRRQATLTTTEEEAEETPEDEKKAH